MNIELNLKARNQVFKKHYQSTYKKIKNVTSIVCISLFGMSFLNVANAANSNKVIHTYFIAAETGFDPVATNDLYSAGIDDSIFETLYTYDYLARPFKLIPQTATSLPQISEDGLTYTIHIKPNIFFADDPVFKGKKRELTSYDYAYSFKRIIDPNLRSPNSDLFDGKLVGTDELIEKAKQTGALNYHQPIEGIQTPDKYTLILKLKEKDYNLPMILAHTPTAAMAKEVVDTYKDAQGFVLSHPVGTGPYYLSKWIRGSRIVLKANPNYRGFIWNFKSDDPDDKKIIADMTGKKMPQIGIVDIQIIPESQSQWLAFRQKRLDWFDVTPSLSPKILENGKLKSEYIEQGITLNTSPDLSGYYTFWNMQDPIVGGLSKEKIALRRAMSMAFSHDRYLSIVNNNTGLPLYSIIPTNVVGYDENFKTSRPYNIQAANLLLDKYQYRIGKDGYRTLPNGKPLVIYYSTPVSNSSIASTEFWQRSLEKIHIRLIVKSMQFPEYLKAQKQCSVQMGLQGWIADYPDGDNFLQLFYGKNIHVSNFNCVSIPQFNALYKKSKSLPADPERQALFLEMMRLLEVYASVLPIYTPNKNFVIQPYVQGFKNHPQLRTPWLYIDTKQ